MLAVVFIANCLLIQPFIPQEGWKTLVLLNRGQWDDTNANLFPKTAKAIHKSKAPVAEAFYASMKPHTSIKPHRKVRVYCFIM